MVPATTSLTGFSGETTWPLRQLRLLVTIGDVTHSTKAWMNFMIVKSLSPYNDIIGRPGLKAIQAVPSTVHGMLKFLTKEGITTIRSSLLIPAECASIDTSSVTPKRRRLTPPTLRLPYTQTSWIKKWWWGDQHRLNIREGCPPVRQKKMDQAPERTKAIQAEVQNLVEARIMREVYYHDWLSNQVMVKKHDGSWRMCVDFTNLNKACLQDCYPLLEIDGRSYLVPTWPNDYKSGALCWESVKLHTDRGRVTQEEPWTLFTDGLSCVDGSGAGLILTNPEGVEFTYALRFQFAASNNKAEYEALITGLRIATQIGVKNVQENVDSKLVANQVLGTYVAKEDNMIKYLEIAKGLVSKPFQSAKYRGKQMEPKQTTRLTADQETINATSVINAQLQAMIDQGVTAALAARDALSSTNGDDSHNSRTGVRKTERATHECTYTDFLKCQPLPFKGTEGVASLS
nr:reverse transcriptase domain-containing protein [Tanacetum cinerariifolium]